MQIWLELGKAQNIGKTVIMARFQVKWVAKDSILEKKFLNEKGRETISLAYETYLKLI